MGVTGLNVEKKLRIATILIVSVIVILGEALLLKYLIEKPSVVEMHNARQLYKNEETDGETRLDALLEAQADNVPEKVKSQASMIDLNSATKEEIMDLPQIGDKLADRIIEYRKKTPFKNIEEIMNVSGIGEKKFANIKEYIYVK